MKIVLYKIFLQSIPVVLRAELINNLFGLAQACIISSAFSFEVIKYLKTETDYLPYNTALNSLNFFTKILDSTPLFGNYQKFFIDLIEPLYNSLGWEERDTDELHDKYEF